MTYKGELGIKVKDRITGFAGIVTGSVRYLSGCNQALVAPAVGADGRPIDSCWYDWQRLEVVDATPIILDNTETPGCDAAAPIR